MLLALCHCVILCMRMTYYQNFRFYIQCQRVLSPCSLNGVTLKAMFTSQMLKWMMPTMCATKSSWHLIPGLPASLLTNAASKVASRVAK